MPLDTLTAVSYLAALVSAYSLYTYTSKRKQPPYPPGPPGLPIIGNLKVPDEPSFKVYRQWSEQYGSDVIRMNVFGMKVIITNTLEASTTLLDKRSLTYSNRPTRGVTMMKDLIGFEWSIAFAQPGTFFYDQQKVYHSGFNPQAVQRYRRVETKAAYGLLRDLLTTPEDFFQHIRYALGHGLVYSAYGVEMKKDDPLIGIVERGLEAPIAAMNPGAFLVEAIPIMKYIPAWFPGAEFQRKAKIWRASIQQLVHIPFNMAKELHHTSGLPDDCAVKSMLADVTPSSTDQEYMEYVIRSALAAGYGAGTDTTISLIQSLFLAVTIYPEVLKKAQREIDSVCHGRLPNFSDYDSLPYVHAVVKELLRWHPALPLNIAHASTEDDIYNGYYIPKGSVVVANLWAILHDPAHYPDPETFNPDRFLRLNANGSYELDPSVQDPDAAFGFGPRICPGMHLVHEALWITVASVLAALDISRAKDDKGREIIPAEEYSYGFMCLPKPFPCVIRPRSGEHEKLILSTVEDI